jgi:prepilin-type N-terminal cleavage/methylation domain-containing protein
VSPHLADRRLSEESGFTLIEVLVATVILVIGLFATASAIDYSRSLTTVSESQTTASRIAQREIETVLGLPYVQMGLTSCSTDPKYQGNCASSPQTFSGETLIVNGVGGVSGGTIDPVTANQGAGKYRVSIYRYVTWTAPDPGLAGITPNPFGDPNGHDYKRVTISVDISATGGGGSSKSTIQTPLTISALATDPCAGPGTATVCPAS